MIWVEGVAPVVGACGMWKEEEDGGWVWITCLDRRDKYKVVGIDLRYTTGRPDIDQKVAVAQLCVGHHVLIYHYCMATGL